MLVEIYGTWLLISSIVALSPVPGGCQVFLQQTAQPVQMNSVSCSAIADKIDEIQKLGTGKKPLEIKVPEGRI